MVLFNEFGRYDALADFTAGSGLALVVHGDRDSYVSCPIARDAAQTRAVCDFHLVDGSDHGFDSREREDEAIAVTAAWLADRSSRS